jgi:hypothetical protein
MAHFVLAVVVDAVHSTAAERFLSDTLIRGARWEQPLSVAYIGEACSIAAAGRYSTEEIHHLRDGMRAIVVPERGA